jgi:thiamine-monophosphate kinase
MRGNAVIAATDLDRVRMAMEMPQSRLALGQRLRGIAASAIDLSDGLIGDLGHVLERSAVGASIRLDSLPRSAALAAQPIELQLECLLYGGDDYELLFTAPPQRAQVVREAARRAGVAVTPIGVIESQHRLQVLDASNRVLPIRQVGFDHFKVAQA